jgi:hypothetical protein
MKTLFLGLILAIASAGAAAQAYKWVDEKGKVHYGDRPPSTANAGVPGTRNAKPRTGEPVVPGMRAEEVWELFGRPDNVRKVASSAGEAQFWTYRKLKGQNASYTIKIENGTVTEVVSEPIEQAAGSAPSQPPQQPPGAGPALTAGATAAGSGPSQQASAETTRVQQCASLKDSIRNTTTAMRRGGSGQQMDQWRDERRGYEQKQSALGC